MALLQADTLRQARHYVVCAILRLNSGQTGSPVAKRDHLHDIGRELRSEEKQKKCSYLA
jgi:hypothetical protein